MAFVTFPEKYAREQGEAQGERKGLLAGLEALLEAKFGEAGLTLLPSFSQVVTADQLNEILQGTRRATNIDDVRKLLPAPTGEQVAP